MDVTDAGVTPAFVGTKGALMNCKGINVSESRCIRSRQTVGRGQYSQPIGFVIHTIGRPIDEYYGFLSKKAQVKTKTSYPKSVNYIITRAGHAETVVPVGNSPVAFDCTKNVTWPFYPPGAQNANDPFIHIGFEDGMPLPLELAAAANLICCLSKVYNIPLDEDHVVPAGLINSDRGPATLPGDLATMAVACVNNSSQSRAFETCCDDIPPLQASITQILASITQIQGQISALNGNVVTMAMFALLQGQVDALTANLAAISNQGNTVAVDLTSLGSRIAKLEACMATIPGCANSQPCGEFLYGISKCQNFVPNISSIINFDRMVSDGDHVVSPGIMWLAEIENTTSNQIQYTISGNLVVSASEWCKDKYARVYLETCDGSQIVVASYTAPTDGAQAQIPLAWNHPVTIGPGQTCSLRLRFETNDTTTPFKAVCQGAVEGRRS